jgi:hypothetical protein
METSVNTTDQRSGCVSLPSFRVITPNPHPDTMSELLAEIRKIPPVTRFVCASIVAVTLPVMTKTVSPYTMIFVKEFVTKRWQARISTAPFPHASTDSRSHL